MIKFLDFFSTFNKIESGGANVEKYNIKEGKEFGQKIRLLEDLWLNNSFKLSNKEIDNVLKN